MNEHIHIAPDTRPAVTLPPLPDMLFAQGDSAPIAEALTIPAVWYTDPAMSAIERELVFAANWQYAGHTERIPRPGDYFLCEYAGDPIIVIRDKIDTLRAFYNVCRHRGGPLATESGNCSMFKCAYHGWTYDTSGKLAGVPDFAGVRRFEKSDFGLIPLQVREWHNLLFVSDTHNSLALEQVLDGIAERIAPMTLDGLVMQHRVEYDIECNWKVYVDNYLEGYHIPLVHPELAGLLDYRNYFTETAACYSLQYSRLQDEENFYRGPGTHAWYFFVFPNYMLNILPGRLQTNRVVPLAPGRCKVIFEYFYVQSIVRDFPDMIAEDIRYSDKIQQEDIDICEKVQRGLQSRGYRQGRYSVKREQCVYHFHNLLRRAYAAHPHCRPA